MTHATDREAIPEPQNPLGVDGIEFIEFATSRPQALGGVLETFGFRPIARHRSREVELYRQGTMNIIVNAQPADVPRTVMPTERPVISAFAVRVRDAQYAYRRAIELGAWEIPVRAQAMEINVPAIHGVGESLIYFVDRYDEFSIYDVDFRAIPTVDPHPPAVAGMHFFGIVQYVGPDRTADWTEFYQQLMGFTPLPQDAWWQQSRLLPTVQRGAEWMATFLPPAAADEIRFDAAPAAVEPLDPGASPEAAAVPVSET